MFYFAVAFHVWLFDVAEALTSFKWMIWMMKKLKQNAATENSSKTSREAMNEFGVPSTQNAFDGHSILGPIQLAIKGNANHLVTYSIILMTENAHFWILASIINQCYSIYCDSIVS